VSASLPVVASIEFKLNKSSSSAKATAHKAEEALAQIEDRK